MKWLGILLAVCVSSASWGQQDVQASCEGTLCTVLVQVSQPEVGCVDLIDADTHQRVRRHSVTPGDPEYTLTWITAEAPQRVYAYTWLGACGEGYPGHASNIVRNGIGTNPEAPLLLAP